MGLSGRKVKQRIGADPRNLSWADDASKFGSAYLAKFGWDSSKGLGAAEEGRTSHIKVAHKLDMLGIGAANMRDPNGIAWKQNKDFENLLKRLNEGVDVKGGEGEGLRVAGFVSEAQVVQEGEVCESAEVGSESLEKEKGKEKREKDRGKKDKESKEKRKGREGDEEDQKIKKRKRSEQDESVGTMPKPQEMTSAAAGQPVMQRHRAHRARAIAAKKMVSNSASAISEILGIAPMPLIPITLSGSATPQGQLTTLDDEDVMGEKITKSTKSVADYFKEKLLSKSSGSSGSSTPTSAEMKADPFGGSRGGLGSSRLRMDAEESDTNGLSMFSSVSRSLFFSAASTVAPSVQETPTEKREGEDMTLEKGTDDVRERRESNGHTRADSKKEKKRRRKG
ncbi:hypothetical protein AX17_001420 [Amanita inopinata Kibby_2008]|nr:hypothetical protein AX17_001420 [Amanita inopinata Kibby_2008]